MLDNYDSKAYKIYKKHKEYREKIDEKERKRLIVNQKYFPCLYCNKINVIEDVENEKTENRTMRAHYTTWKKLKDLANEKGGYLENAILYLLSLHEKRLESNERDDYEVGVAGFGGGDDSNKK